MGKIPYVSEYKLFESVEFKQAEEILAEYNDFYIFNLAQINSMYHDCKENYENDEEIDEEKRIEIADRNARNATDHFITLFGSKDFAESAMIGFHPAWYDIQRMLLEEYKHKTPLSESATNWIARYLRNVASVLLFAQKIVSDLEKMGAVTDIIDIIKDGFRILFEKVQTEKLFIPEYHKTKAVFAKFRKAEQYIEFCGKLWSDAERSS